MPGIDLTTALFAAAIVGLAVIFSVAAGIVTARIFFRASREVDDTPL